MSLKHVTQEEIVIETIKHHWRELGKALAEYDGIKAKEAPEPETPAKGIIDPRTGKPWRGRKKRRARG